MMKSEIDKIKELRIMLRDGYAKAQEQEYEDGDCFYTKSSDGCVDVCFGSIVSSGADKDVTEIDTVMVYSYSFGPSRSHYFKRGPEKQINYYTWQSPDPLQKAIDVVRGWIREYFEEGND